MVRRGDIIVSDEECGMQPWSQLREYGGRKGKYVRLGPNRSPKNN